MKLSVCLAVASATIPASRPWQVPAPARDIPGGP